VRHFKLLLQDVVFFIVERLYLRDQLRLILAVLDCHRQVLLLVDRSQQVL